MKKCLRLPRWTCNASGFTLIECSLVVGLVGILLFLTSMQGRFLHRLLVRSELDHLHTTCYYLQKKAMMMHTPQKLTFDTMHHSYHYEKTKHILPAHVCFGCPDAAQGPPANPSKLITHPVTFKNNTITFYPTGIMQAGTVYLCDSLHEYGYALTCAVSQLSYLRKYQYTQEWSLV